MGSVAWSARYFPQGVFTAQAFNTAEIATKAVLDEALDAYRPEDWEVAYGSSGTIGAVGDMLATAGHPARHPSPPKMDWLQERMLRAQSADRLRLEGLKEERRPVIGGGLSVLRAVFELLQIDRMQVARALRQGALYDLLDREQPTTTWSLHRTLADAALCCGRSTGRAGGAGSLRPVCRASLAITPTHCANSAGPHACTKSAAASRTASRTAGAYILDNTDVARLLAARAAPPGHAGTGAQRQGAQTRSRPGRRHLCLATAVPAPGRVVHARRDPDTHALALHANTGLGTFELSVSAGWTERYPQSAHLLREEVLAWQKTPWTLALDIQ